MASEAPAATDDDDGISCRDTLDAVAARFRAIHKRENASSATVTCPPVTPDRSAAVLIGLFADHKHDGGRVHVLLTKRSSDLRQHGGEVALPVRRRTQPPAWLAAGPPALKCTVADAFAGVRCAVLCCAVLCCAFCAGRQV